MRTKTRKTIITESVSEIDKERFLDILYDAGFDLPRDSELYVKIPVNSTWSNGRLNIDKNNPIIISYKTVSTDD